ncbi:uncharacterized protein PG986_004320 [Apiospora aurea]|uniref:MIT domain-containing protein n=1 Tax=Apiospora aurea TaxID=335848 RepID=A0ABR1QM97_9PEZI
MTNLAGSTKSQSQSQSQLSYQNHHHHAGYPFTNLDSSSSPYSTSSTKTTRLGSGLFPLPPVLSSFNTRTPTPTNAYPAAVAPIYSVAENFRPESSVVAVAAAADSPHPFQSRQKPTNFSNPTSFASRTSSPASAFHYNRGRTDTYSSIPRGATTLPSAADIGGGPGPTTSHSHATPNPSTFAARATSGSRDLGRGFDRDQILIGDSSDYRPPDETQSQRYPPLPPPPHLAAPDNTKANTSNHNNAHQAPSSLSLAPSGAAPVLLPRTSSLLPPPRNVGYAGLLKKEPIPPEPATKTKPRRSHSRASSIGVITDSFRNLNRWSASTSSSSRASNRPGAPTVASVPERAGQDQRDRERGAVKEQPSPQQQQSTLTSRRSTFSRRMSVDSIAIIANATDVVTAHASATFQSPRKLSKRRPSDGGTLTASPRSRANSNASSRLRPLENSPRLPSAPAPNLPPIVSLPSLEFPDTESPEPATARPTDPSAPATNLFSRIGTDTSSPSSPYSSQGNNSRAGQRDYLGDEPTDSYKNRENIPTLLPAAQLIPNNNNNNTMPTESRGHTRTRSSNTKSSSDSRERERGKQPSQKAMLSKALAKANTAVQLDNAQDYQSARRSYSEACDLLQHVLARTTGEEDKKKLEAIRRTYTSRIDELDGMAPAQAVTYSSKALPARPESLEYNGMEVRPSYDDDFDDPFYGTATTTRYGSTPTPDSRNLSTPVPKEQPAPSLQSSFNKSPIRRNFEGSLNIPRAQDNYMPAPLSPRRPISPGRPASPEHIVRQDFSMPADRLAPAIDMSKGHTRNPSHESTSWLDPIDESGGSAASSVHSRTSSRGYRRKHIRAFSGDTEAEFDAALDAAVEAAYDEGYEPMDSSDIMYDDRHTDEDEDERVVANAMRRVEWAKEQVRQTEREAAIEAARERDLQRRMQEESRISTYDEGGFYNGDSSDEEEERMLEDMTRNLAMQSFTFDQPSRQQSGSGRDRESDSSGVTQRTWHSSMGSNPPPTASTVLSTVTEMPPMSAKAAAPPPSLPPPQALPQIPPNNVRSRRLSGQNAKQLEIETTKINPPPPPGPVSAFQAKPGNYIAQQRQAMSATSTRPGPFSNRVPSSPGRNANPPILAPPTPPSPRHTRVSSEEYDEFEEMRTDSPTSVRPALRKNQSSSSLRSQKTRQLSVANTDITDISPNTPMNVMSGSLSSRQPAMPTLPTPIVTAFSQKITGGFGGLYLFDSDFHSPLPGSPTSINQAGPEVPLPLEPCPADAMLRPFWLMRALYQTLCHPRGGYITNKLFIPRDVWKVKGVKLRAIDDKSSQCDLLTAALLNLSRVDSNDADAVLEEMQSFENVLEQVQITLTKKLGNEVGIQGMARENDGGDAMPAVPRSASVSGKGAFSWRRLRSKGSAANMSSAYGSRGNSGGTGAPSIPEKEVMGNGSGTLPSLPMVANPSSRPAKRDVHNVQFDGPYALYMLSLARLFDAAQTVDQIARQVDDPGLRHADKTQVGLELCTRHAAEFFGFYICRFVLSDLGLLLDKFVKRGSEWVLV